MGKFDDLMSLLSESKNRTTAEFEYYFEEVFGDQISDIEMTKEVVADPHNRYIWDFTYKGTRRVRLFVLGGVKGQSMSLSVFDGNEKLNDNAFFNSATGDVSYDPVTRTPEHALQYTKSVLDQGDRDRVDTPTAPPTAPVRKDKPVLAGV